jgi:hypothetical protein
MPSGAVHTIIARSDSDEAIQSPTSRAMDCFVARAPRNDGSGREDLIPRSALARVSKDEATT